MAEVPKPVGVFPTAKPEERYTGKPPAASESNNEPPPPAEEEVIISEKTKAEMEAGKKKVEEAK